MIRLLSLILSTAIVVSTLTMPSLTARAISSSTAPDLGAAQTYSVLAGTTVGNTGASTIGADLGTYPGTTITGFPPGIVTGNQHLGDSSAAAAHSALQTAYDTAASQPSTALIDGDIGGRSFAPGVYRAGAAITISSNIVLDAGGDPGSYFIFQVDAAMSVAASVRITLKGGAQSAHVFWQVNGAISMGASVHFVGSLLGNAAITLGANASLVGNALTLNGAISLSSSSIEPQSPIDLGTAGNFSALAESTLINTGPTVLSGNVGVSPGTSISGFPPGITSGSVHSGDSVAAIAQSDLASAYIDAGARVSTAPISGDISGRIVRAGVYTSTSAIHLSTDLTLDGGGSSRGIYIFQINGGLDTSVGSRILLINGAQPSNVFWRVSGQVILGGGSYFRGTILGATDILVGANTNLLGRTLSRQGIVSLRTSPLSTDGPVALGLASTYSVLGGSSVTNTGASTLQGDLGVSPGTALTGFPPGLVGGSQHAADSDAAHAQEDLYTAYTDAAGRTPTATIAGDIGGRILVPGVYRSAAALSLSTSLVLDGLNNPNAIFIFQIQAAFATAAASSISLVNGALASNVFWQVTGAASLGANSTFNGTILGLAAVSVGAQVNLLGRVLAINGAVSLDANVINTPPMGVWYLTATIRSADLSPVILDGTSTQIASRQTSEWVVTDNRGTQAGWTLAVSATPPTSVAGTVEKYTRSLAVGKLSIDPGAVAARDRPGSIAGIHANKITVSGEPQALVWSDGTHAGSYTFNPTFNLSIPPNTYRSNFSGTPGASPLTPYVSTVTYTIN